VPIMNASIAERTAPRFRIAPTPSGFLHHGNITAFLFTWACCKALGGKLLLRIDDLDYSRYRPEYLDDIFRKLEYYQIDYDEGPSGPDDFIRKWSQVHRIDLYKGVIRRLQNTGLLFACSCSRSEIAEGKICDCRNLTTQQKNFALKIATAKLPSVHWKDSISGENNIDLQRVIPDFVIQRKDQIPAYQIASIADDLHFGITDIIRGQDLLPSTAAQLSLADLLHENDFRKIRFYHHPLIQSSQGIKLSKSAGDGKKLLASDNPVLPDLSIIINDICHWLQVPYGFISRESLIDILKAKFRG